MGVTQPQRKPVLGIAVPAGGWYFTDYLMPYFTQIFQITRFSAEARLTQKLTLTVRNSIVGKLLRRHEMCQFLAQCDVALFEWANWLLVEVTSYSCKPCPIATRMHGWELYGYGEKVDWSKVDRTITVSSGMKRQFQKKLPEHAQNVIVIPESVDSSRFKHKHRRFTGELGMVARITPRKRIYETILLLHQLIQLGHDFRLHIAGARKAKHAEYDESLSYLIRHLHLEERVVFYDYVHDIARWYSNIDIFVSNSTAEGLQVSPLEACVSGCYCLSHFWEGADDVFPNDQLFMTDNEAIELIRHYAALKEEQQRLKKQKMFHRVMEYCEASVVGPQIATCLHEMI